MAADALELEDDQPVSCPAKEIFFRRSKTEHNWRKNNFRVADVCELPNEKYRNYTNAVYQDFFVRLQDVDDLNIWHISWVDPSEGNKIRSGSLTKPKSAKNCKVYVVYAASNKVRFFILFKTPS